MSVTRPSRVILGAGGWGTALAVHLARTSGPVALWGHRPEVIERLKRERENKACLPGVELPPGVHPVDDLNVCRDAETILFVTPSRALREVSEKAAATGVPSEAVLVSCTKGIEHESGKRMTQVIGDYLPGNPKAALSGPSHAEEVGRMAPTAISIASEDLEIARQLQQLFTGKLFRVYTSTDVAGVELGGALKNIYAIAAGVSDGLGLGDNAKAALVTRALAELIRLGVPLGGRPETFQGLSGVGDLMVTCFSRHSRNRGVGERLGRGETLNAILDSMGGMVAEGVPTTRSAWRLARKNGARTPIIEQMHSLLYESGSPAEILGRLMDRNPRDEQDLQP